MLIGKSVKKSLPDMLVNLYDGKRDACRSRITLDKHCLWDIVFTQTTDMT